MKNYRNVVEDVVEEYFDEKKDTLDVCTCDQCRNDIIAYTLNQLTPHYVSTNQGEKIVKAKTSFRYQNLADVQTAFTRAIMVVKENPRHKK